MIIGVQGFDANLSPDAFHRYAEHYYKCRQDFVSPSRFSPVPYFLLCRAIELELKSRHLRDQSQSHVKKKYGHGLLAAYNDLPQEDQILSGNDMATLTTADAIYSGKGFEYFTPRMAESALQGYKDLPDLAALDSIARRLIQP